MVTELRPRRKSVPAEKAATKAGTVPAPKRKAPDDSSPVANKKTKALKADAKSEKKSKIFHDSSPVVPVVPKKTKTVKADAPSEKKPKATKPVVEAVKPAEPVAEEEEHVFSEEEEDQALVLAGIVDNDAEDEEVDESIDFKEGQDVGKAPKPSKAVVEAAQSKGGEEDTGVVYFGRLPHGFYEHELRNYLSQFGDVKNVRLSRNKKTGASKHYAFIEFAEESTANIVAKTMNNYLLFGHILKCSLVPKSQVHPALFRGANKRFKRIPHTKIAGKNLAKPLSEDKWAAKISRTNQKRADKAKKLKEMGYEFESPELVTATAPVGIEAREVDETSKAIEAPPSPAEAPAITKDEVPETTKAGDEDLGDGVESLDGELAVGKFSKVISKDVKKASQRTKKPSKPKKSRAKA